MARGFGVIVALAEHDAYDTENRFLRQVLGHSMLAILDRRIRRIGSPRMVVCVLPRKTTAVRAEAQRLGWHVVARDRPHLHDLPVAARCLRIGRWLRLDLAHPFVDPDTSRRMLEDLAGMGSMVEAAPPTPLVPVAVMGSGALVRRIVRSVGALRGLGVQQPAAFAVSVSDKLASCLSIDTADEWMIEQLGGIDFPLSALERLEADHRLVQEAVSRARDRAAQAVSASAEPHRANAMLARFEMKHRFAEVKSLPTTAAINISRACNARCLFCVYGTREDPGFASPRYVTLRQFRDLDWLRFVEHVTFGSDVGDPLTNPEYDDIVAFLRSEHPHINLSVLTNGLGLTTDRCDALIGEAESLQVSLHAARRETWERLTRARGFDRVVSRIGYVAEQKRRRRADLPWIVLLVVLTRENIEELVEIVDLAHRLGVQMVEASHYEKALMPGCDLPDSSSLFVHQELSDHHVDKARRRARELGVRFNAPLRLFREDPSRGVSDCGAPWMSCMLVFRPDGRPVFDFCCVPVGKGVGFSWSDLREEAVRALWNDPIIQHFRATVNSPPYNRVCAACRRGLHEEPDGPSAREIAAGLAEIHAHLDSGALSRGS